MGTIGWTIAAGGSIIIGLIGALIRAELSVWYDPLIKFLIHRAASKASEDQRVAIEAELLSWIGDVRSPTMKLMQSFSLWFSANRFSSSGSKEDQKITFRFIGFRIGLVLATMTSASFGIALVRSKLSLYEVLQMIDQGAFFFSVPGPLFWFSLAAFFAGTLILTFVPWEKINPRSEVSRDP